MFTREGNILLADLNEHRIGITVGLAAWFPFWGDLNDRATKGMPFTLTNNGTSFVPGVKPDTQAMSFDGGSATCAQVLGVGDFTISAWIKSNGAQVPYACPLSQGHDVINRQGIAFTGNEFYAGLGTDKLRLDLGVDFNTNTDWNYFTVTYVEGTLKTFLNCTEVDSGTGAIVPGSFGLTLGDDTYSSKPFDGLIQDVRLYNRGLSLTEIGMNFVLWNPAEDNRIFISRDQILYLAGEYTETNIIS